MTPVVEGEKALSQASIERPVWPRWSRRITRVGALLGFAALCTVTHGAGYEAPRELDAQDVLPAALQRSAVHRVARLVKLDENLMSFEVTSATGLQAITSVALLERRVAEFAILAQAEQQYARQVAGDAREIRHGFSAAGVRKLSSGVGGSGTLSSQLSENDGILATRGRRPERGSSAALGRGGEGPIFDAHRRNVAYQVGLDPYSANPQVQRFLDTVAAARTHGRFGAGSGLILARQRAAVRQVEKGRIDQELRTLYKHLSPAELEQGLEAELLSMGMGAAVTARFMANPHYTPSVRASVAAHVDFLGSLPGREAVLVAATGARTSAEAVSFEQLARMLAVYHESTAKLVRLIPGGSALPGALRHDGTLVLMLPVDYVYWNRTAEQVFDSLRSADTDRPIELVVRGQVSPRAREELTARTVTLRERFLLAQR